MQLLFTAQAVKEINLTAKMSSKVETAIYTVGFGVKNLQYEMLKQMSPAGGFQMPALQSMDQRMGPQMPQPFSAGIPVPSGAMPLPGFAPPGGISGFPAQSTGQGLPSLALPSSTAPQVQEAAAPANPNFPGSLGPAQASTTTDKDKSVQNTSKMLAYMSQRFQAADYTNAFLVEGLWENMEDLSRSGFSFSEAFQESLKVTACAPLPFA